MKTQYTTKLFVFLLTLPFAIFIAGCDNDSDLENAAEDAGDAMQDTAEEVGDQVEDATQ